ncbi:hypothetical protein [Trueperella pyogenes]|nr:hypothetical protein [Trueperella pyogenes]
MPTDAPSKMPGNKPHKPTGTIPGWGDAICFNELHHPTPYHNTWD